LPFFLDPVTSPTAAEEGLDPLWSDRLLFDGSLSAFFFFFMSLMIIQILYASEIIKLI